MQESKTKIIRTLEASFSLEIAPYQIRRWRGAFVEMAGRDTHELHNHKGEEALFYRYPLIQYRVKRGKASIWAINEGINVVQTVLSHNSWQLNWDDESLDLHLEDLKIREYEMSILSGKRSYVLHQWIALNQENYDEWNRMSSMQERLKLLEGVLAGHILRFASAMEWRLPERLEVVITNIKRERKVSVHSVPMIAFDIQYKANIFLPNMIGLGKAVAFGYGWQAPFSMRKIVHYPR